MVPVYCRRKDLPALLRTIAALERSIPADRETLVAAQVGVGWLYLEKNDPGKAVGLAVSSLKLVGSDQDRSSMLTLLVASAEALMKLDGTEHGQPLNQIETYIRTLDFDRLAVREKGAWMGLLEIAFPLRHLETKARLGEQLFRELTDPRLKGHLVLSILLNARRQNFVAPETVSREYARGKAEFLLRQAPEIVSSRQESSQEVFHTLVINLKEFGLDELAEEAIGLRQPESGDPIFIYLRLCSLQETDLALALEEVMRIDAGQTIDRRTAHTVWNEIRILKVKIMRQSLEHNRADLAATALPPMPDDRLTVEYYSAPRSQRGEALKTVREIRARLFARYTGIIRAGGYFFECKAFRGGTEADGDPNLKTYLLFDPMVGSLEVYFPAPDPDLVIKARFPLTRDQQGRVNGVNPQAVFEGVPEQGRVPFLWEYMLLRACLHEDEAGLLEQLEVKLRDEIVALNEAHVLAFRDRMTKALTTWPEFQLGQIELHNRLTLARKIVAEFNLVPRAGKYALTQQDLLSKFFREVEVMVGANGLTVTFVSLSGQEHLVDEIDDWYPYLMFDLGQTLTRLYLTELTLTALIKLSLAKPKKGRGRPLPGYLLEPIDDPHRPGDLADIYRYHFYRQLYSTGLSRRVWYYREAVATAGNGGVNGDNEDSFLFKPLSDKQKTTAIGSYGAENLYITVQPSGMVQRLRVGKLRGPDGEMTIGPYRRNPLREVQQKIFGDSRPLPDYHGLYLLTTFSDGNIHLQPIALREKGNEIADQGLIEKLEAEIASGKYRRPDVLLRETEKAAREKLAADLETERLKIVSQTAELYFPVQTTFSRPHMVTLASLLDKGFVLE